MVLVVDLLVVGVFLMVVLVFGGCDWYVVLLLFWWIDSLDYVLCSIGVVVLVFGLGFYL